MFICSFFQYCYERKKNLNFFVSIKPVVFLFYRWGNGLKKKSLGFEVKYFKLKKKFKLLDTKIETLQ